MVNAFSHISQKVRFSALASGLLSPEVSYLMDSSQESSPLEMTPWLWWDHDANQKEQKTEGEKVNWHRSKRNSFPIFVPKEIKGREITKGARRELCTVIFSCSEGKTRETLSSKQKLWRRKGCSQCLGDRSSPGMSGTERCSPQLPFLTKLSPGPLNPITVSRAAGHVL